MATTPAPKYYAKPKPMAGLPKWAKEIRAGSQFMPEKINIKPVSYNYMALMETPTRSTAFAPATNRFGADLNGMIVAGGYNMPTEKVAGGMSKLYNLKQDMKAVNTEPVKQEQGWFARVIDVISRPLYAVANVHLDNAQRHYMDPSSAGGSKVTLTEHLKAFLGTAADLTPMGLVHDAATGQHETWRAAARGFSGKDKTTTHTILEKEYPGFTKEHPLAATLSSIVGDIVFDPLTWISVGATGPGTVLKSLGSAAAGSVGKKALAKKLFEETLFSSTGRAGAKEALRVDRFNAEIRKLTRQQNAANRGARRAAQGKKTKLTEAEYLTRSRDIGKTIAGKKVADIKGADFAWRLFKSSIPLAGLNTLSKANMGASAVHKVASGGAQVGSAYGKFINGIVDGYEVDPHWQSLYASMGHNDIHYTHGNRRYTVPLSEAKNFREWLTMVTMEGAPVAKLAEHSKKAARGRKMRIGSAEARARDFLSEFDTQATNKLVHAMGPDAAKEFNRLRTTHAYRDIADGGRAVTQEDLDNAKYFKVDEDDLHNMSIGEIKKQIRKAHGKGYRDKNHNFIVKGKDGENHWVSVSALNTKINNLNKERKARIATMKWMATLDPEDAARFRAGTMSQDEIDSRFNAYFAGQQAAGQAPPTPTGAAQGAPEGLAEAQQGMRDYLAAVGARKAAEAEYAGAALNPTARALGEHINRLIHSTEYTDEEREVFQKILRNPNQGWEDNIKDLLNHMDISNEEVINTLDEVSTFKIVDGQLTATLGGTGPENADLQRIVNEVLSNRFKSRMGEFEDGTLASIYGAAGYKPIRNADGSVSLQRLTGEQKISGAGSLDYQRAMGNELGMAVLDAWRMAINHAIQTDLLKDPEMKFDIIRGAVDNMLNEASASIKQQVFMLMYNMTNEVGGAGGVRLPEKFVPSLDDLNAVLPGGGSKPGVTFMKADGTPVANQEMPWQNLAIDMQKFVMQLFNFLPTELLPTAKTGYDMPKLGNSIWLLSRATHNLKDPDAIAKLADISKSIEHLEDVITPGPINGIDNAVNRYNFLDFMLHTNEIIKSQDVSLSVAKGATGKEAVRLSTGRLSALDSFTFMDKKSQEALKSVLELKKLSQRSDETGKAAQIMLAQLFMKHGGVDHIKSMLLPQSGNLADIDFGHSFSSLGIHARLKEQVSTRGFSLDTRHRADLMDELWGAQTLHHEWQKAAQNAILHDVIVEGKTHAEVARQMNKNLNEFFDPFDNLKSLLHPVKADGSALSAASTQRAASRVRRAVAPNNFNARGAGALDAANAIDQPVLKKTIQYSGKYHTAEDIAKAKAASNKNIPFSDQDVTDLARRQTTAGKLKSAREAEAAAAQVWDDKIKGIRYDNATENVAPAPGTTPIPVAATPAGAGGAVGVETPAQAADFINFKPERIQYTEEEIDRVRQWIATTYAKHSPQQLAAEMHAMSAGISSDIMMAQARIITGLSDFDIRHKTNLRFMGVPLMNTPNPMNASHAEAAVTALEQSRSRASNFFRRQMDPDMTKSQSRRKVLMYMRRPSYIVNEGLNHIRTTIANAATQQRKLLIKHIDNIYINSVIKGKYIDPILGGKGGKEKFKALADTLFNPSTKKAPTVSRFDLADGTNPARTIMDDFDILSDEAFDMASIGQSPGALYSQLKAFNKYVHKDFRLTDEEITKIVDAGISHAPYTTDWLREVGELLSTNKSSKLNTERLLNANVAEMHYWFKDAHINMHAGSRLQEGVWSEFASLMSPTHVRHYNDVVVPQTIGVNGQPMRSKLVSVKDVARNSGIASQYIPAKYIADNYYISEDFLPEIKVLFEYFDMTHELNDVVNIGFLNKILNYFKSSVTVYNIPGYPVRNLMSDVFMSAMDGVVNPRHYGDAASVIWRGRKDMQEMKLEDYNNIIDRDFMVGELARYQNDPQSVMNPVTNPGKDKIFRFETREGMTELTETQIYHVYNQLGLNQNQISGNIAESVHGTRRTVAGRAGGKTSDSLRTLNDVREDFARMAHFLYALEREAPLGGNFDDVARRAADRVIKHHFDYADVSLFERKYLANWIPFYKWIKNIIPYTLSNVLLKPKFLTIERAISEGVGTLIDDDSDEGYGRDITVASWIKHDLPVPIGVWSDAQGNKFQQFSLMYLPLADTMSETLAPTLDPWFNSNLSVGQKFIESGEGLLRTGGQMMSPVPKAAVQGMTNRIPFASGAKDEAPDENWASTLAQIIPGVVPLTSLGNTLEGMATAGDSQGRNKAADVLKALGAARVYDNSENAQSGELNAQIDQNKAKLDLRKNEIASKMVKDHPGITKEQAILILNEYIKENRKVDVARIQ